MTDKAPKKESNIESLWIPAKENMTVRQCLTRALCNVDSYKEVLIIGYDKDDDLCVNSSGMKAKDALWLLDHAKDYVRKG